MHDLRQCVIRILNVHGKTLGAGFVISDHLAVSCAHVIRDVGSDYGRPVQIQFVANEQEQTAFVLSAGWSPPNIDDVAFLKLEFLPEGVTTALLASAERCSQHAYSCLGFAKLAGYDKRWASGTLEGTISMPDNQKQRMLQLKGPEIKGGMSGAPILDTQMDRIVGMVSEFKDDDRLRIAWATTSDTLLNLASPLLPDHPTLRLWSQAYGPEELKKYLEHLIASNQVLQLPDGRNVLLERIYVSLQADGMNAAERLAEHSLHLGHVEMLKKLANSTGENEYAEFDAIRRAIARHPTMLLLKTRNWQRLFGKREQHPLSLAEVEKRHRYVVVLGDPGSGKTTLGKWLVLQFAHALLQGKNHVQVHADQVQPEAEAEMSIDLGPARLPILIRIADYARERWGKEHWDSRLSLEQFISFYRGSKDLPFELTPETVGAMAKDYLAQGHALIVLDGLDEVSDPNQRRTIMQTVKNFIQAQSSTVLRNNEWAGNRLLLTSRIIGYQFDPLTELPHYTVEDMDETAINSFCQAWMAHVAKIEEAEKQGKQLKKAIFDHSHPGVRTLAGNPLLLTILAQVYWESTSHLLPTRRVSLFDQAFQALYRQRSDIWKSVEITPLSLTRALGAVAAYIHENEKNGFVEAGTVRALLMNVFSDRDRVETVLEAAREVSGFLVERGEGVYGFLHRAVQEYFAAKYLADDYRQVDAHLAQRLLDPTWREPIVLAVGVVSQPGYLSIGQPLVKVFDTLLDTPDPAGDFLPRRELLAVAACVECERVPEQVGLHIAERLLALYARHEGNRRSPVLRKRILDAFITLHEHEPRLQAETALCNALLASDFELRYAAIDIVIETQWDSLAVARALAEAWAKYTDPAMSLRTALDEMIKRSPTCFRPDFLPLRQAVTTNPLLWEKAEINRTWKAIFRVLYLPLGAYFKSDRINRDSPLTPYLLEMLRKPLDPMVFVEMQHHLVSLACQPGTTLARDAALALSALGDGIWIQECVENADSQGHKLHPIMGCLVLALSLELALDRNQTFSNDCEHALKQSLSFAHHFKRLHSDITTSTRALQKAKADIRALEPLVDDGILRINTYIDNIINDPSFTDTRTYDLAINLKRELELLCEHLSEYAHVSVTAFDSEFSTQMEFINKMCKSLDIMDKASPKLINDYERIYTYNMNNSLKNIWEPFSRHSNSVNSYAFALEFSLPLDIEWARKQVNAFITPKRVRVQDITLEHAQTSIREQIGKLEQPFSMDQQELEIGNTLISVLDHLSVLSEHRSREYALSTSSSDPIIASQAYEHSKEYEAKLVTISNHARALAAALGLVLPLDISRALKQAKKLLRDLPNEQVRTNEWVHDIEVKCTRILARAQDLLNDLELAISQELSSRSTEGAHSRNHALTRAQELTQLHIGYRENRRKLDESCILVNEKTRNLAQALSTAEKQASKLERQFEQALRSDIELSSEIDLANVRYFDLILDLDLALNLARPSAYINEIVRSIHEWQNLVNNDFEVKLYLKQALLSAQKVQKIFATSTPIAQTMSMFIEVYTKRWPRQSEPTVVAPESVHLISDNIMDLVNDLTSANDVRREHAKALLDMKRKSSTFGQTVIEQIADLINQSSDHPQITTLLIWTLEEIIHDQSSWITDWIEQITDSSCRERAKIIMSSVHHVNAKVCENLINILPHNIPEVNRTLLKSLNWLIRLKQVARGKLPTLQKKLFSWLASEKEPDIRCSILDLFGHWPEASDGVGLTLLDQIDHPTMRSDLPSLYKSVAWQAVRRPNIVEKVRKKLRAACSDVDAAAALIRLIVARNKGKAELNGQKELDNVLNLLSRVTSDTSHHLKALLKAGIDDNIWDNEYHGILINTIRAQIELQVNQLSDQNVLTDLLSKFEQALQSRDWPLRRFILAAVAACTEAMPVAVQDAWNGSLEALLTKATTDAESFNSRRFALTALSYLRTVTPTIIPALLAGCYDTEDVQKDTITAANHFQSIEGDLFPVLLKEMNGESLSRAYMVTHLLSALGSSAASETSDLRNQIIKAVVDALRNEASQREVIISGVNKGKLEDALYTTLLQVAGWMG